MLENSHKLCDIFETFLLVFRLHETNGNESAHRNYIILKPLSRARFFECAECKYLGGHPKLDIFEYTEVQVVKLDLELDFFVPVS